MHLLLATLREFLARPELSSSRPLVVAFSGGPDSTALLAGLAALRSAGVAAARDLVAAHFNHTSAPDSAERARRAGTLAERLGVPFVTACRDVATLGRPGESWETAARRLRYDFLEQIREAHGAGRIALAHHRDDQAETVLLRFLLGSNLQGLSAMRPIHGAKIRPLLGLAKSDLVAYVRRLGLAPVEDPSNLSPAALRNRIRHRLLPALSASEGRDLPDRLCRLAERAAGASERISSRLAERFSGLAEERPFLDLETLRRLPPELFPFALASLSRAAGLPLPPSRGAMADLARRLAAPNPKDRAGAAIGPGRRWRIAADRLSIEVQEASDPRDPSDGSGFTYTFWAPGRIEVPEAGVALILRRSEFAPWMREGRPDRAGLALPPGAVLQVEVRSRRPGDRLRPLGAPGSRKLKELLIDRRIDRARRDSLPLLCVGGSIAWVPGVAIDDRFRVRAPEDPVWPIWPLWIAEIEPLLHPSKPTLPTGLPAAGNPRACNAVTPMEREPDTLAHEVAEP